MDRKLTFVFAAAVALLLSGATRAADFALGFQGCPDRLTGASGEKKTFDVFATLTTTNNATPDGAQGWSIAIAAEGGTLRPDNPQTPEVDETGVTVAGVHVSTIFDNDGKAATPPIDPSDLDLNDAGFVVAEATSAGSPKQGAVSAIVLHQTRKRVLQPGLPAKPGTETQTIAKLTVEGTIPDGANCTTLTLSYQNGLIGSGQPVNNVVTFGGKSQTPTLGTCTIQLCPPSLEFNLAVVGAGKSSVPEGDNELVATVAAGVALVNVDVLLTSAGLPPGDGPQGWSVSVGHEACMGTENVTVEGVHVSTIFDNDGKAATPPIDPSDLDLGQAGFVVAEPTAEGAPPGAVSAIVLHQTRKRVLHANATDTILRIVYKLTVEVGKTTQCRASIVDGLVGSGQPVNNVITFGGKSNSPTKKQGLVIKLTGQVGVAKDQFVRGDANNDGKVDIGDAIWIVYDVVPTLGGGTTVCPDSGDANDDEALNLSDAIYLVNWQFNGSKAPPLAPWPACGTDEDSSDTKCPPESTACPPAP